MEWKISSRSKYIPISKVLFILFVTTRTLWDLWFKGNLTEGYAPYRQLKRYDLGSSQDHTPLSKARRVIIALAARCPGITYNGICEQSQKQLDALFEPAFLSLCAEVFPTSSVEILDSRRIGDRSYRTVYDYVVAL